eukprot:757679-Hanusia_phi.AAC.1
MSLRLQRSAALAGIHVRREAETKQSLRDEGQLVVEVPEVLKTPLQVVQSEPVSKALRLTWKDEQLGICVNLVPGMGICYSDSDNGSTRFGIIKRLVTPTQFEVYILYDLTLLRAVESNLQAKKLGNAQLSFVIKKMKEDQCLQSIYHERVDFDEISDVFQ